MTSRSLPSFPLVLGALIGGLIACGSADPGPAESASSISEVETAAHQADSHEAPHDQDDGHHDDEHDSQHDDGASPHAAASVEVAQDGTRFDPAVTIAQIPNGAWVCDMNGSVHFASLTQDDGNCPICNMTLSQKGAASAPSPSDHAGHEH